MSRAEVLAKVLAKHRLVGPTIWTVECACGGQEGVDYYTHIAAALDAALAAQEGERGGAEVAADIGADHGHWAAFDNTGTGDFVCECGLPWSVGEGCVFVSGGRAALADSVGALRQHDAEVLRAHRQEWASYFESWSGAVGPEPLTVERVIAALGWERVPFGVSANPEADRIAGDRP